MQTLSDSSEAQIKQAVRRRYAQLALLNEPCCGPKSCGTDELGEIPKESVASAAS